MFRNASILLWNCIDLAARMLIVLLLTIPFKAILYPIFFTSRGSQEASATRNWLSDFPAVLPFLYTSSADHIENWQEDNNCDNNSDYGSGPTLSHSRFDSFLIIFRFGRVDDWIIYKRWCQVQLKWYFYFDLMIIWALVAWTYKPCFKRFILFERIIFHHSLSIVIWWPFPVYKPIKWSVIPLNWSI
jgi:hypothetical protein